jgi:hypothetical protein
MINSLLPKQAVKRVLGQFIDGYLRFLGILIVEQLVPHGVNSSMIRGEDWS